VPLTGSLSLRTKFALGAGLVALASWLLLASFTFFASGQQLSIFSRQVFEAASRSVQAELRSAYEPVESATALLARSQLVEAHTDTERLWFVPLLAETLRQFPAAAAIQVGYGNGDYFIVREMREAMLRRFDAPAGAAYSADIIDGPTLRFRRWFYDKELRLLEFRELPAAAYDPRTRPWYQLGMTAPGGSATPPYLFFFMREIGVTLAHASSDRHSVVATDLTLAALSQALAALRVTPSTEALIRDSRGVIAWSGKTPLLAAQPDGSLRRRTMAELDNPAFAAIAGGAAPAGWLVHRATLVLGDNARPELVIAVPEAELLSDLRQRRDSLLAISFVLLALVVPLVWLLANRISTPLRDLHKAIARVGGGDFDFQLPEIRSRDEVGDLNLALRTMRQSLKSHIEMLAAESAARQRMESELDIARRIQMGLVPGDGQLSRTTGAMQLFARLVPARAVGGDFYDVIELPDARVFIGVGDVSDKGIPAALFMSRAVTLAKTLVPVTPDLAQLLFELNNQLAVENTQSMFITFFCAFIEPQGGQLRYASAGHNPPVHLGRDGARFLPVESGPPLGLFADSRYVESSMHLGDGERLVIYTDGITEAFDGERQQFSDERLLEVLNRMPPERSAEAIGTAVLDDVASFVGSAPQSDDITLLIVGRKSTSFRLVLRGAQAKVSSAIAATCQFALDAKLSADLRNDLCVIVDEVVANWLCHGCASAPASEMEIEMSLDGDRLLLRFSDTAPPFDPLAGAAPDLSIAPEDRPIGGLGLHLIRALTDSQRYAREGDRNLLELQRSIRSSFLS